MAAEGGGSPVRDHQRSKIERSDSEEGSRADGLGEMECSEQPSEQGHS
jgi:hypothetical protein